MSRKPDRFAASTRYFTRCKGEADAVGYPTVFRAADGMYPCAANTATPSTHFTPAIGWIFDAIMEEGEELWRRSTSA